VKIGFLQFAPALSDLRATLVAIEGFSPLFAGADLLVLPEMCNSGYYFESAAQAWATSEEIGHSAFLDCLASLCRQYDCYIVSGFNERAGDCLYNSAVLLGPQGYVGRYRKLHLFMNEKDFFQPGNAGLPVFDIGSCKVGMLVCFDWLFPEVWRILALKGADVICHPANLVLPRLAQQAVPIHALVNRVYVVTANRTGSEGKLTFTGTSIIADPRGEVLVQASATDQELRVVEVDLELARDKTITSRNDVLADRRPEEYALLCEKGGRQAAFPCERGAS
jgi:predicted amidohydrolase